MNYQAIPAFANTTKLAASLKTFLMNNYTEKYRTGGKRILAAIVDGIVFMPFLLVDRFLLGPTSNQFLLVGWGIFTIFIPIFYSIIAHYSYGKTIGKWVVGVKVLDVSEQRNISIFQSFLRDGVYLLVQFSALVYYAIRVYRSGEVQYLLSDFNGFATIPVFFWTLIELVTMLTNSKRRAVHDYIARSVVVRSQ